MMYTNAQLALMAAAEHTDSAYRSEDTVLERAKRFLKWLEENE